MRYGITKKCILLFFTFILCCGGISEDIWEKSKSEVTGLSMRGSVSMPQNKTFNLQAAVSPPTAYDRYISYTSDDPSVATVDAAGNVSSVGAVGTSTVIRAVSRNGNYLAVCSVQIRAPNSDTSLSAIAVVPNVIGSGTAKYDVLQGVSAVSYLYAPIKYAASICYVYAAAAQEFAQVELNSNGKTQSSAFGVIPIPNIGTNNVTVTVTAENNTVQAYTLDLYRAVPVFKTGQTNSAQPRDDGDLQKGVLQMSYDVRFISSAGYIYDQMTGLTWDPAEQQTGDITSYSGAASPWRVPNVMELESLNDYGNMYHQDTVLNSSWGTAGFASRVYTSMKYWDTATFFYYGPNNGRFIDDSAVGNLSAYRVLHVSSVSTVLPNVYGSASGAYSPEMRGVAWPAVRFRPQGMTVIDNMTGLQWYYDGNIGKQKWTTAMDIADALNGFSLAGYSDWRVPNVKELASLLRFDQSIAVWLNTQGFVNIQADEYWTSTATPQYTAAVVGSPPGLEKYAWHINMNHGIINFHDHTTTKCCLLLVRGSSE